MDLTMVDLDNLLTYEQVDTLGMLTHLHQFPQECQRAWEKALIYNLPQEYSQTDKVIVLGMGGSAIGGEIIHGLTSAEDNRISIWIYRDYDLPSFIDERTLVIISSYSGNTEETLSAFTKALKTPAKKLVLTRGGELKSIATKEEIPVFIIDYQAPPRAAFPHSFVSLLGILQKLGLIRDKSVDFQETIYLLHKLSNEFAETVPLISNPAKKLASKLCGYMPIIYGAGILSGVAQRWKDQFNENSKNCAFFELFPELNHNAVAGYGFPPQIKEILFIILLHSTSFHPRVLIRYQATAKLLDKAGINHEFVETRGESALEKLMSLILLGDYVSFYLAILNRIDPTPVNNIDFIKQYLNHFPIPSG
jgi:glucose/mannose-6-phosphate isomerase